MFWVPGLQNSCTSCFLGLSWLLAYEMARGHFYRAYARSLAVRLKRARRCEAEGPRPFICTLVLEPGMSAPGQLEPEPSGARNLPSWATGRT